MNYLHQEFFANSDDVIEVILDNQANVMLLDSLNFDHYRKRESFRYYGGRAKVSPMRLAAPHSGRWHVVVDLGGHSGRVRAGVKLLKGIKS